MSQEFWVLRALFSPVGPNPQLAATPAFLGHTGAGKAFCGVLPHTVGGSLFAAFFLLLFKQKEEKFREHKKVREST